MWLKSALSFFCVLFLASQNVYVDAGIVTVFDKATFLSRTGAVDITGPIPQLGYVGYGPIQVGQTTFRSEGYSGMWMGEMISDNPGAEVGMNDLENVDVYLGGEKFAAGFEFYEPNYGHNATYANSTFRVDLYKQTQRVGSFTFNATDGVVYFVGFRSTSPFDRVRTFEISGGIENDFYGRFYASSASVPEPSSAIIALSLAGFAWRQRRLGYFQTPRK